jgi:AraC-like DNA-binding protein
LVRQENRIVNDRFQSTTPDFLNSVGTPVGGRSLVTLKRLATNIGYANVDAFSGAFNRRLGVSPSEYRRQFAV